MFCVSLGGGALAVFLVKGGDGRADLCSSDEPDRAGH